MPCQPRADSHKLTSVGSLATLAPGHPDNAFVHYVLGHLAEGFQVGFDHSRALNSVARNMHSGRLNAAVIDTYITAEVGKGECSAHSNRGRSPPYTSTAWGWSQRATLLRLITDLSYPEGGSVNDGFRPELCSLRYTSVEAVAAAAQRLGKGHCWRSWILNRHTGLCRCTPATDGCWALNGGEPTT